MTQSLARESHQAEVGRRGLPGLVERRSRPFTIDGVDQKLINRGRPLFEAARKVYFRVDSSGWERLPEPPVLLVSVHAGVTLTMDAWSFVYEWWHRFGDSRLLHGTSHDVLLALPLLREVFQHSGVIRASRDSVTAALAAGHDVIVWPGGEKDSMRAWTHRDQVQLAGRSGFVRQAIRSGVSIVPVATTGGSDTAPVLFEGSWIARHLGGKRLFRAEMCPVVLGPPLGVAVEILPMHVPLPAKIRFEILDPIEVDHDPQRAADTTYVRDVYLEVERALQAGVDRLARQRRFPILS